MEFPQCRDHSDGPPIITESTGIGHGPLRTESNEVMMSLAFITRFLHFHKSMSKGTVLYLNLVCYEPKVFTFLL